MRYGHIFIFLCVCLLICALWDKGDFIGGKTSRMRNVRTWSFLKIMGEFLNLFLMYYCYSVTIAMFYRTDGIKRHTQLSLNNVKKRNTWSKPKSCNTGNDHTEFRFSVLRQPDKISERGSSVFLIKWMFILNSFAIKYRLCFLCSCNQRTNIKYQISFWYIPEYIILTISGFVINGKYISYLVCAADKLCTHTNTHTHTYIYIIHTYILYICF
jgi:hypothetical protein